MQRRDHIVNGRTYSILLPPPTQAQGICTRAAVLVGTFAGLFQDMQSVVKENATEAERLNAALGKLGEALRAVDPVALNQLMLDAAQAARLTAEGNVPICSTMDFDRYFASQYREDIYPLLLWCLWECVSDFFPQLGAFTQVMKKAAGEAFASRTTGQMTTG